MTEELKTANGETILLIEDNQTVRRAISTMLDMLGYKVLTAGNGPEAMEIAQDSNVIDLLLSDIVMPGGMNGFEISEKIREQRPTLKCLFMSGYASLPDNQIPQNADFLGKPFELKVIADKLQEILSGNH